MSPPGVLEDELGPCPGSLERRGADMHSVLVLSEHLMPGMLRVVIRVGGNTATDVF